MIATAYHSPEKLLFSHEADPMFFLIHLNVDIYGYSTFDRKLIIPNDKEHYFVKMEGGEYYISVICGPIEIFKLLDLNIDNLFYK
jgi:hypothetical protein